MKSDFELSRDIMNAFGQMHPQAFDVPAYQGSGVNLGYPTPTLRHRFFYWLGTCPFNPNPNIFISVTEKTKHPPGVPKTFEYEGKAYEVVYEVRPPAYAL